MRFASLKTTGKIHLIEYFDGYKFLHLYCGCGNWRTDHEYVEENLKFVDYIYPRELANFCRACLKKYYGIKVHLSMK
jgi:hypothetical protein